MLHRLNKTRAAKEGVIEPSAADLIRPFVAVDPDEPPRYALHFGKVDKVGVNPKSRWDTPLAVCAYPLTEKIFDQFLRIDLPFAQKDAKYLFVLEIKPDARVFYSTKRFFNTGVGPEYLDVDVSNVKVLRSDNLFSRKLFYSTRPSDYDEIGRYFVEGGTAARAAQWGHKLWKMGIDVWVDADDEGILHENEPSQVMFFNPSSYRVVLSMDNPKSTYQARFGRDWLKRDDVGLGIVERARAGDKNLTDANLEGADLSRAKLTGANLTSAKLHDANLYYADLRGATLTGANLTDANLTYAILIKAKLIKAKLIKATLYGANLYRADLTNANLNGANLYRADLTGADLLYAILTGAILTGAILTGAILTGADLTGANLYGANLYGEKLNGAKLIDAILTGAKLTRADLRGADLTGADLYDATLTYADLDGIIYDEKTIWPYGFTPPPSAPRPNRR